VRPNLLQLRGIKDERSVEAHRHFADDHNFLCARPSQSEVDAEDGEDERYQAAVDFGRIFEHEVLVFDELEQRDEDAAGGSVQRNLPGHE
jgi:hypothetical protein